MATNGGTARDAAAAARRRRIAYRGAERLALITGRVQSFSPSPPSPPCPTSDQLPPTDENNNSASNTDIGGGDVVSDIRSVTNNTEPVTGANKNSVSSTEIVGGDVASDIRSVTNNTETGTETSAQTSSKPDKRQSFPDTLTEHTPPILTSNKSRARESQTRVHTTFSLKQLRPAISASENARMICSVTVAVLVILAYAGFPILGSDAIQNIILFRPLLLLLVTNITIVAAHFLLQKVKPGSRGVAGFADPIGTALEWGLLVKTGSSALFMDCSVYSVVVICGMGFLQMFRQ